MATMVKTYWNTSGIRNGYNPFPIIEFSNDTIIFKGSCEYCNGFLILDELDPETQFFKNFFEILCGCFEDGCNLNDAIKDIFGPEASVNTICIHACHIPVMVSSMHHDLETIYESWKDDLISSM